MFHFIANRRARRQSEHHTRQSERTHRDVRQQVADHWQDGPARHTAEAAIAAHLGGDPAAVSDALCVADDPQAADADRQAARQALEAHLEQVLEHKVAQLVDLARRFDLLDDFVTAELEAAADVGLHADDLLPWLTDEELAQGHAHADLADHLAERDRIRHEVERIRDQLMQAVWPSGDTDRSIGDEIVEMSRPAWHGSYAKPHRYRGGRGDFRAARTTDHAGGRCGVYLRRMLEQVQTFDVRFDMLDDEFEMLAATRVSHLAEVPAPVTRLEQSTARLAARADLREQARPGALR